MVAFTACSDRCPGLATSSSAAMQPPTLPLLNPCGFCGSHPCSGNVCLQAECIIQAGSSMQRQFCTGLGGLSTSPRAQLL